MKCVVVPHFLVFQSGSTDSGPAFLKSLFCLALQSSTEPYNGFSTFAAKVFAKKTKRCFVATAPKSSKLVEESGCIPLFRPSRVVLRTWDLFFLKVAYFFQASPRFLRLYVPHRPFILRYSQKGSRRAKNVTLHPPK